MHKGILSLLDLCVGHFWTFVGSLLSLLDLYASLLSLLHLCGLDAFHFWTCMGMMPFTSGPVWAGAFCVGFIAFLLGRA